MGPGDANAAVFYVDRHVAEGRATREALRTPDGSWSYGELLEQVERAGALLGAAGVRRGDRVAIVLPDTPEAAALALGGMRVGAIPAALHTRLSDDEYAFVCGDARPQAAVVSAEHVAQMERARARTGWPRTIVALEGELPAGGRSEPAPTRADDAALLQYTSGSTGRPKGVVHLHRGLLALPGGFGRTLDLRDGDLCFSAAKLFFGYGFGNSLLFPLAAAVPALLRAEPSEPIAVLETIERERPTVVFGGPALYAALLAAGAAGADCDTSGVRLWVSAGEALAPALSERWREAHGRPILDGLGSTECLHVFLAGAQGALRPVPPYAVQLLDDAGAPVPSGTPGHVHVAGPADGARYWERPDATRETFAGGWVRTGDLMTRSPDGTYAYVGRSDDVFKVRGMKIAPLEIEACLNAHPAVAESAVVPGRDRSGLTVACAFVRLERDWTPTTQLARTLRAHARASLSPHKVPRQLRFVDDLPRNGTGKLGRARLREVAADVSP